MKVEGHLMQVHFIEIHQVFAKKKTHFYNRVVYAINKSTDEVIN